MIQEEMSFFLFVQRTPYGAWDCSLIMDHRLQYFGTFGSISSLQARMPPATLETFA